MSSQSERRRSPVLDFAFGLAWVAITGVAAAAALGAWARPLDTLGQFAAPALTVAVLGAAAALLTRRWASGLLFAAAACLLAFELVPQWTSPTLQAAAGARPVRVYFNNLYRKNADGAAIRRSIADANADVVALVEVSDRNRAAVLEALSAYPYRLESEEDSITPGLGVTLAASRYPLRRIEGSPALPSVAMFGVAVDAPQPFHLFVSHFQRPWPYNGQNYVFRRVKERLADEAGERVVVAGDFNATLSSAALKRLRRETGLSALPAIFGDWPAYFPPPFRIAIENAMAGPGVALSDRRLGRPTGSDHRPIVFEVSPAAQPSR
jgi:endonuclease/exonuclease/phosphatase (EEP) superfamily protein YafD